MANLPTFDPWGVEYRTRLTNPAVHRRARRWTEAKEQYRAALLCPVRDPDSVPWAYLRLAQIANEEKDLSGKTWALR
ncbi:MAG: hypothetical protein ACAH95_04470 [Fimbriimonas sp.]